MAGEAQQLLSLIKLAAKGAIDASSPMDYVIGTVVSDEYKPLEIKVEAFSDVLEEDDLILTKAVQDHWLDIEVYWETVDDNDLSEFQANHYSNVEVHNSNSGKYNSHVHKGCSDPKLKTGVLDSPDFEMMPVSQRHTSHLHNIQGRKKIRVYNGLHKGEIVLLLRCAGGQQYIVVDRLSPHIVGGEWRTHAGAILANQEMPPYEVADEKVLSGWQEGAKDESGWKRFDKPPKFVPGGQ